jgi:hypothetical protein
MNYIPVYFIYCFLKTYEGDMANNITLMCQYQKRIMDRNIFIDNLEYHVGIQPFVTIQFLSSL